MAHVRVLVQLALLLLVLGVALGVAWYLVSPTPEYVVGPGGLMFASTQPTEFIAMDGWFAALALVPGLVAGVYVARRDRWSVPVLVLLGVGGLAGSWLAWRTGHLLGPSEPEVPYPAVAGDTVYGPLELEALGVLAVWPVVSLVVVLFALAWRSPDPDPDAEPEPDSESEPAR